MLRLRNRSAFLLLDIDLINHFTLYPLCQAFESQNCCVDDQGKKALEPRVFLVISCGGPVYVNPVFICMHYGSFMKGFVVC